MSEMNRSRIVFMKMIIMKKRMCMGKIRKKIQVMLMSRLMSGTMSSIPPLLKPLLKEVNIDPNEINVVRSKLKERAQANINTYLRIMNLRLNNKNEERDNLDKRIKELISFIETKNDEPSKIIFL